MARTAIDMPRQIARDFGTCLNYSGTSAVVAIGNPANLKIGTGTLSAWIKLAPVTVDSQKTIFLKINSYNLYIDATTGQLTFFQYGGAAQKSGQTLNDGKWHYVALTFQTGVSSGTIFYIDGVAITTKTFTVVNQNGNLTIGAEASANKPSYFLDEAQIYDVVLTPTQIVNLYYRGNAGVTPLGWWKFDEGSGTSAIDSGTGGNNGTITAATYSTDVFIKPRTVAGQRQIARDFGTCLNFNGTSGNAQFADSATLDLTGTYSISAWIKPTATAENQFARLYEKASAYYLTFDFSTKKIGITNTATAASESSGLVLAKVWNHIVATYDGANVAYYINGVAAGTPAFTTNPTATANPLYIGNRAADDRTFNGKIDDLRIYKNRVLTSTEAINLYYGIEPSTTGLVLHAKFDEGSGSTPVDSSGTQANGTLTTATYSTDVFIKPRTTA